MSIAVIIFLFYLPFAILKDFSNLTIFSVLGIFVSGFVYFVIFIDCGV